MQDTITFSTLQLILGVLGFGLTVAGVLLSGALWLDRKRSGGDERLHQRVDAVAATAAEAHAAVARVREDFVPKRDFQRLEDRLDTELKGLRQAIDGGFERVHDRFDRLLAERRQPAAQQGDD